MELAIIVFFLAIFFGVGLFGLIVFLLYKFVKRKNHNQKFD